MRSGILLKFEFFENIFPRIIYILSFFCDLCALNFTHFYLMKTNNENRQRHVNFEPDNNRKKTFGNDYKSSSYNRSGNSYSRERNNENNYDSSDSSYKKSGRKRFSVKPAASSDSSQYKETKFDNNYDKKVVFRPRKNSEGYDPNAKYSKKKQITYSKNNVDPNKPIRLNKFLANAGVCSRREADDYIKAGVISVNGNIVSELGVKILPTDKVLFHNEPVRTERKVYILLNKPKDTVTTTDDPHNRHTVLDIVKHACSERIYPVGRLDRNTTGVLLLTNDGDLASKLTHPKFDKKKIYHVVLDRNLEQSDFDKVLAGVDLEDFTIAADALSFVKEDSKKELGIEIHTGQNRVVRRIFEKLGYKIYRLDRVYFAGLTKKNLPRGKYRFLSEREVNMLKMGAFK